MPECNPGDKGADKASDRRRYSPATYNAIIHRLNQAPEKNKLAFLDLLGLGLVSAQAARAPMVFQLSDAAPDSQITAGAQVAAPPPPGSSDQIVFETERALGLAGAQLKQVVSLWPGRDQYLDHSADYIAGKPVESSKKSSARRDTTNAIYICMTLCSHSRARSP